MTGLVLLGLAAAVVVAAVWIHNRLVSLRNRYRNAFAQIGVQLERRHDLIPNLVETAQRYLEHERETLEAVVAARNAAARALPAASSDLSNAQAMQGLARAEAELGGALGRLLALSESYPELKANETMAQLSEELTSTENRVAFARQAYNDAVMEFNTACEVFPNSIIAARSSFRPAEPFEISRPEVREAPRISL